MKIGIVGAGIVGRLMAWRCLKLGYDVTVYHKDGPDEEKSCSFAAAGMIAPYAELREASHPVWKLGLDSMALWPGIISQLDKPVNYEQKGGIILAYPQDISEIQEFVGVCYHKIGMQESMRWVEQPELQSLEPGLNISFNKGLLLEDEGVITPREILASLKDIVMKQGVHWHDNTFVETIMPSQVKVHGKWVTYDEVIDCRGIGAKGDIPGLRSVRGELIRLHAPEVNLQRPVRVLHPRYPIYIVPHPDNHFYVGSSMIDTDDLSPISLRTTLELLSTLYSLHSGFAEARIVENIVNRRAAFSDNEPKVIREPGLIRINGMYRHGYLLAPIITEQAMGYISENVSHSTEEVVH